MEHYGSLIRFLLFLAAGWSLVSLAVALSLCVLVPTLALHARKKDYRGSWWALYQLGLHASLAPLYCQLRQGARVRFTLSRIVSLIYELLTFPTGAEIPLNAKIGKGLFLFHTAGVVLNWSANIGDYCIITKGVVVGSNGRGGVATIGRNVYIGANAVIAGPLVVGDGATIGAGAIVTRDVPPYALVIGNPGLVVKENYRRSYHNYANEAGCE
jgi:serine acetyltransferase